MSPSGTLCIVVALLASSSLAFNYGHHNDLIRSVLRSYTYTADAADVVVLGSWYTDYFAFLNPLNTMEGLVYLHYDALNSDSEIREYTERVRTRLLSVIDAAGAPEKRLLAFGAALHAAADLMSHSNWGEDAGLYRPSCGYYRSDTPTRFTAPLPFHTTACTSPCPTPEFVNRSPYPEHGGQCNGTNRDNYSRKGWEEAYVFAYFWLMDWVESIHTLRPQIVTDAASYSASWLVRPSLKNEINATWNFNTYYKDSENNGLWKAPGSGRATPFSVVSTTSYMTLNYWRTTMGNMQKNLGGSSLYTTPFVGPASQNMGLTSHPVDVRIVYIRFPSVQVIRTDVAHPYDLNGNPYINATVNGQVFMTEPWVNFNKTFDSRPNFHPNWKIIAFVPRSQKTVNLRFELWDQNYAFPDNLYELTYPSPVVQLSLDMDTKTLTDLVDPSSSLNGVHSTDATAAYTPGSGRDEFVDSAEISFVVDVREAGSEAGSVAANCHDELPVVVWKWEQDFCRNH